eukprot:1153536-Pelagomonas_calceolata.AAC.2
MDGHVCQGRQAGSSKGGQAGHHQHIASKPSPREGMIWPQLTRDWPPQHRVDGWRAGHWGCQRAGSARTACEDQPGRGHASSNDQAHAETVPAVKRSEGWKLFSPEIRTELLPISNYIRETRQKKAVHRLSNKMKWKSPTGVLRHI